MYSEEPISVAEYEFETTRSFELGIGSGLEQASVYVMKEATAAFEKKRDEEAKYLRKIADYLKTEGNRKAEEARNKEFPIK